MGFRGYLKLLIILALTVGVVCSCCSCAVASGAQTELVAVQNDSVQLKFESGSLYSIKSKMPNDYADSFNYFVSNKGVDNKSVEYVCDSYFSYLSDTYSSTIITRQDWLETLFEKLDIEVDYTLFKGYERFVDRDLFSNSAMFMTAVDKGILGKGGYYFDPYCKVTRQYVARTLVDAVGYEGYHNMSLRDYSVIEDTRQVCSAVYFEYLSLDENNCFNPYQPITQQEIDNIVAQLDILNQLKGKTILAFGDSIMHGDGNNFNGIADLLGEKYMMQVYDYSKGGATFGYAKDREQISNQVLLAIKDHIQADVILINGGSNDMRKVSPGTMSDNFEYGINGRKDYASGMEYAFGLLKDNYPKTPVIYIRAHNMDWCLETNEIHCGKLALDICNKWEIEAVDIYNDTDFDAHNEDIRYTYTVHTKTKKNGDSVHPNKQGYYKYYLPLVTESVINAV